MNTSTKNFKLNSLSRNEMKKITGGDTLPTTGDLDPAACENVNCPAGTSLFVIKLSDSAFLCECTCGNTSSCL